MSQTVPLVACIWEGYVSNRGPGSVVGIATAYGLDGAVIESRWGRDFPELSRRPCGSPNLFYNRYRVFPEGKVLPGRDPSPLSSAEVKDRIELYFYYP